MPHTGVYFIPSSPSAPHILGPLTERLRSVYGDQAIPIGRWGLEHKLMRDTPSCLPASAHAPNPAPSKARYVQFLSMTNYPKLGFIYASEDDNDGNDPVAQQQTASGMIMSTVPIPSAAEIFRHFVRNCEPIWCHRHTVTVTGTVYDVGDFRVRLGELRQMQPQARVRGTIMEIEWRGPSVITAALSSTFLNSHKAKNDPDNDLAPIADTMDIDAKIEEAAEETPYIPTEAEINTEYTQIAQLIRDFWAHLAITQHIIADTKQQAAIRESILVADVGREVKIKLSQRRSPAEGGVKWQEREIRRRQKRREAIALDRSWGGGSGMSQQQLQEDEEEELEGGVDLARQYMELFRFSR
ncbi:hypothetical protein UA08_05921 [Talaromyces atroroseus]|uniref:Mediator of RNA polymerase II transcription subunit 20 n=1 Tax=Talaromyces atroroseus TaxID=1441469 RepID=A0A225AF62_TALAT|nr:hypothetical protein UA08_05921 [Talaromyces atroroseus]OKL59210.1 hypothetical protein UA08_05921 [Talaromyces atroroseus]